MSFSKQVLSDVWDTSNLQ